MEKNWFIFKGDHHLGPFSSEDLVRMLQHDKAKPDDLIWKEGEKDWLPLQNHPALLAYFEPPAKVEPTPVVEEDFVLKQPVVEEYVPLDVEEEPSQPEEEELPPPLPPLPVLEEEVIEESVEESSDDFWSDTVDDVEPVSTVEHEIVHDEEEPALEEMDEMPPPLPPLPVEEFDPEPELEEAEIEPEPEIDLGEVEDPEPEVEEKLVFDDFKIDQEFDPHADVDDDELEDATRDDIIVPESLWEEAPAWQKSAMVVSLALGLIMSLYFFNWDGGDIEGTHFSGISRSTKKEMIKIANTSPKAGVKAKLALSNTGNEIWLATNQPGEAIVYLSLKSIKDKILADGSDEIELRSVGELKRGGAKFRNLELSYGSSLAEGEYEASLVGYATGWKSRLAMELKKYDWSKSLKFVKRFKPDFKLTIPFLYSIKQPKDFEKLLDENKKKLKQDLAKPYEELIERHKTFSSLLSNIQSLYSESLKKMGKGADVRLFERRYALEIEPILRDLLLDSNRQHIALMNSNKKRSEDYLKLVDEGKQIGILVSDIVTRTRKYGKMTNKKRTKLEGIFAPRIQEILKVSKEDVVRLETDKQRILTN